MGWRFRKSFSPLPGVRLTLSPRGITTSVGAGPLRFTVGSQGASVTARALGTGIAYRHVISTPTNAPPQFAPPSWGPLRPSPSAPVPPPAANGVYGEIRSAPTTELTSAGLAKFRELLTASQQERRALLPELRLAQRAEVEHVRVRTKWERGWLFKRLFPQRFLQKQANAVEAKALREELEEQERQSRLQTQIDMPDVARRAYAQCLDAFARLTTCARTWDTISRVAADRVRERTTADHSISRELVTFDFGVCDLIESEWKVPRLGNANGGDLYLYPGFVLLHISADAFALVDIADVMITSFRAAFIEEEQVPPDTTTLRQTWMKANKDGSPDRRFANNYAIPVVEYGRLAITSLSGLNEEYMLSNANVVEQFTTAWNNFRQVSMTSTT